MGSRSDSWEWQGQNKKGIRELRAAFDSANSSEEMLKIFKKIEARLQENEMGFDCLRMAAELYNEAQDPLKILSFGKRALNIALTNAALSCKKSSLIIASILHLLGSACCELKRYNESLSYLNWSDRNLITLLLDNPDHEFVLQSLCNTHVVLCKLKKAMGKGDEAIAHAKRVLEIKENIVEKGCIKIGKANKDVSEAYTEIGNFKEALPFALKALEIFKEHLSDDSKEVTILRISLAVIYSSLREFDKAFEQNRSALGGLKSMGDTSFLLSAETYGGRTLVVLGRYEEAIVALKPVISQNDTSGNQETRSLAFMGMAIAFCRLEKLANARKYI